jgi:hypothetical protein
MQNSRKRESGERGQKQKGKCKRNEKSSKKEDLKKKTKSRKPETGTKAANDLRQCGAARGDAGDSGWFEMVPFDGRRCGSLSGDAGRFGGMRFDGQRCGAILGHAVRRLAVRVAERLCGASWSEAR